MLAVTDQLQNQVVDSGLNVTLNDSLIILVSPEVPLDNVLLTVQQTNISSNISTVIALNSGSYELSTTPTILTGQVTLIGGQVQPLQGRRRYHRSLSEKEEDLDPLDEEEEGDWRRSLLRKHYPHFQAPVIKTRRRLSVTGLNYSVIEAPADTRGLIFLNGLLQTDLIVFSGVAAAQYAGGVEVVGSAAEAIFIRTDFLNNRWYTQGGGLTIVDGARVTLGR